MLVTFLEVAGLLAIGAGLALAPLWFAVIVAGIILLGVAVALEVRSKPKVEA